MKRITSSFICLLMIAGLLSGTFMTASAEQNSVKVNVVLDFSVVPRDQVEDRVEAFFYWSATPIAFSFDNGIVPSGWSCVKAETSISDTLLCAEADIHPVNTDEYYLAIVMFGHSKSHPTYRNALAYYVWDISAVNAERGAMFSEPEDILIEGSDEIREDEHGCWCYNVLTKEDTVTLTAVSENDDLGTVTGTNAYSVGTDAVLKAEPVSGAEFVGWYKNDKLVSENAELALVAAKSAEYLAKFVYSSEFVIPEVTSTTSTEITIKTTKGLVYSIDGETWTEVSDKDGEYTFHGLDKDTEYTIYTKIDGKDAVMTTYASTASHDFKDLPSGAWFTAAAEWCFERGYMTGLSVEDFAPDMTLSRAMYVQILSKIEGVNLDDYTPSGKFTDVPKDAWFAKAVEWAYQNDITSGTSATTFGPNDPVTREQLATFFYAYANKKGLDTSKLADLSKYTDAGQISSWARVPMKYAVANGLISGTSETTLSPKSFATRGQVAVIFMAFVTANLEKPE